MQCWSDLLALQHQLLAPIIDEWMPKFLQGHKVPWSHLFLMLCQLWSQSCLQVHHWWCSHKQCMQGIFVLVFWYSQIWSCPCSCNPGRQQQRLLHCSVKIDCLLMQMLLWTKMSPYNHCMCACACVHVPTYLTYITYMCVHVCMCMCLLLSHKLDITCVYVHVCMLHVCMCMCACCMCACCIHARCMCMCAYVFTSAFATST